ncbi:AIG2-like family protein [Novipirellula aureliae]|uniref:AIG2-like family protein n=1 Tax=Novipirellula aureliae TaxID=2527966 RepID=A0A5C6DWF9_9BACT|nr:gamma-glutamylcyclotransferase family protein [Novipirellula aureliae]TWU40257.1 AIG2-like family protein [Novipirellula aureliae]
MRDPVHAFFVYGTLKQGGCRDSLWPCVPLKITSAWTYGTLYDRADYPAMMPGQTRVKGEYRLFRESELPEVLEAIDAIEGTNQYGVPDLYHRVVVDVFAEDMTRIGKAYTYHYAIDPAADGFSRMMPRGDQTDVEWLAF